MYLKLQDVDDIKDSYSAMKQKKCVKASHTHTHFHTLGMCVKGHTLDLMFQVVATVYNKSLSGIKTNTGIMMSSLKRHFGLFTRADKGGKQAGSDYRINTEHQH